MKLLPCREGKFIGHQCFTTNYDYSNIYLLLSRKFMEEGNFHPSDYDSLKFNESLALASDKTDVKNQFNLSKLSTIFQRIHYQNNIPISSLIITESESLNILPLIIFFYLPLFSIISVRNFTIMKWFRLSFYIFFLCFDLDSCYTRLCEVWRNIDWRNCLINTMRPYLSERSIYIPLRFLHFQPPSNPCKVETFKIIFTLRKLQLQLNIYSWQKFGRQRDLLSGPSGFHRGWRLRATSSAEIFARALINYSINPPGILLARCPGESSLRLEFYHLINGGVSFGWLDSRRGRLLE